MSDVLLAVGTRKGLWLLRSSDRRTWEVDGPHLLMKSVAACAIDTRGGHTRVLAGASYDHWGPAVSWSDDLGATWHEAPDGSGIRFPSNLGASVENVWQIRPDTEGRPGVVWAGTEPSALWRSDDHGETFSLCEGLWNHPHRPTWEPGGGGQALHTILPHPDNDRLLVAMSTGGVYASDDGGQSWNPSNTGITADFFPGDPPEYGQCVHKVVRDAADPDVLYLQNHPGVFRSDDGGASWSPIDTGLPSNFGFPIVSNPHRSGMTWALPLSADMERMPPERTLQVWRTDDGGASWNGTRVSEPGVFYASVLRDAMTVDDVPGAAGVYLGTRDGTVYASNDEGESWSQILAHLPDVLCVRAALLP
ncbi:exo-alpha-sialidase [Actinobacteria bacterium YIM 96077]|uniref:Exo-alpha-sialidase n=1 Tax=Phytoactinopolyspora halophila TaxID=1981511 RepID=A0A329QG98_9ACTN|nr:sialidase family protein [Phytoactinopolyspora halophila]AYY12465.1 exo-alpha-sialidase [Actinobacteria bacterium YIM 96077]RAW09338.1 exo-alpha-sialidase [Phytoactinopolyspora halophila]